MKTKLLEYFKKNNGGKSIKDRSLVDELNTVIELDIPIKQKAALILLGLTEPPKCDCGSKLDFIGPAKSYYTTPFGGWRQFCSKACMHNSQDIVNKRRATNIEKYGFQSFAQTNEFKELASQPWSDSKKDKYNEAYKKTVNEKYGVDHFSKTNEYIQKRNETSIERFGVQNVFQSEAHKQKIKETSIANNGYYGYFSSETGRNMCINNNPMHNPKILEKARITRLKRIFKHIDPEFVDILINKDQDKFKTYIRTIAECCNKNRYAIAARIGISYPALNRYLRVYDMRDEYNLVNQNTSAQELEILNFVKEYCLDAFGADRTILDGKEIDIVIPSRNIGIEVNGIWAHSEHAGNKYPEYHLEKTELAESKGIQLLHIFESEWDDPVKQEIWKSIILNKLGLTTDRIYARKCEIMQINAAEARRFLNNNHLAGFRPAFKHLGLYYNGKLVSVMSFGKSLYQKEETWEVVRFASLINTVVVGALSKLIKHSNIDNLICYADRRFSSMLSTSYSNLFNNITTTPSNWFGFRHGERVLSHRLSYTKEKVMKLLGAEYDQTISVFDNMVKNNYDRIWDSGNIKYSNR